MEKKKYIRSTLLKIGDTMKSVEEHAKDYDIHPVTLVTRLNRGMEPLEAVTRPIDKSKVRRGKKKRKAKNNGARQPRRRGKITIGDKTLSATDWAKQPGVTVLGPAINTRLRKGWSPLAAVFTDKRGVLRVPEEYSSSPVEDVKSMDPPTEDMPADAIIWLDVDPSELEDIARAIKQLRGVRRVRKVVLVEEPA